MRTRFVTTALLTFAGLAMSGVPSYGWNRTGHRATALIAYRQLDEGTRQKVAALLRRNPVAHDLWTGKKINSDTDPALDAFMQASTFPDDVRPPSLFSAEYHHGTEHYVTFRLGLKDDGKRSADPTEDDDLFASYAAYTATVKSHQPEVSDARKALALCWILHQVGDIHQPLHAVSRYSNAFPEGDRGGNLIHPFPNPRGKRPYSKSLHSYWDDMLGDDDVVKTFDALAERVEVVLSEFPRARFRKAEIEQDDVRTWARESCDAARDVVYRDLDPEVASYDELPVAYEADAQKLARRRIALAGYRLAEVLNDLFGDPND
jgi:hypothetical protein